MKKGNRAASVSFDEDVFEIIEEHPSKRSVIVNKILRNYFFGENTKEEEELIKKQKELETELNKVNKCLKHLKNMKEEQKKAESKRMDNMPQKIKNEFILLRNEKDRALLLANLELINQKHGVEYTFDEMMKVIHNG